jgi:muramidase (phage lysozyme)
LSGEPVGRAAAKAVGFSIGSALGTFVPVPFVGTILGGMLGDIVGGALYDTLVGNKPEKPEVVAKSKGGKVTTRKGKVVGGPAQRKVRRIVRRVVTPPKSSPIDPGKSVGGEEKLKKIYPEPPPGEVGTSIDPYGTTVGTAEMMGEIPFLGPLFNIFGKTLLGDMPNKGDYQKVGMGLGAWINTAISQGMLQGNLVSAFSNGGIIDDIGKSDISGWVEKSVEDLVKNKVTEAINELNRNLGLESLSGDFDDGSGGTSSGGDGGGDSGNQFAVYGNEYEKALLDTISQAEGTSGPNGYKTLFGGGTFDTSQGWKHPNIGIRTPWGSMSTAAGRYQFLTGTWNDAAKALGLNDFSPRNQDKAALWLAKVRRGVDPSKPISERDVYRLGGEWAAFEGGPRMVKGGSYGGQAKYNATRTLEIYNSKLGLARSGRSVADPTPTAEVGEMRLQNLKVEPASHSETGSGWTVPGQTDQRGRPVVLSKEGALAFAKMIEDSRGVVTGRDVASSQRSRAKNDSLPGAAKNSLHLTGLAMDIHNASGSWIRRNGSKYGWVANDYSGSHGGHFEFRGGGSGNTIRDEDISESGSGMSRSRSGSKSSGGGKWGFGGRSGGNWGFGGSGGGNWGFGGSENKKKRERTPQDSPQSAPGAPGDLSSLSGKDKKIYLHWNVAGYDNPVGPYHAVFLGDGRKVQNHPYDKTTPHTHRRNNNAIGLAVAAMGGTTDTYKWVNPPTITQLNAMANEVANIAKSMNWTKSDINKTNVMTHAEAAFLDGYGYGSGDPQTKWDMITLKQSDMNSQNTKSPGSKGGNDMRNMIIQKMQGGGPVDGDIKTIQTQASYDRPTATAMLLQQIITTEYVQMPVENRTIAFVGGVNSRDNSQLYTG